METPRCNYCQRPATIWFQKHSQEMGQRLTLTVAACDDHKAYPNFKFHLEMNPVPSC
jgi:hypothetical protein